MADERTDKGFGFLGIGAAACAACCAAPVIAFLAAASAATLLSVALVGSVGMLILIPAAVSYIRRHRPSQATAVTLRRKSDA